MNKTSPSNYQYNTNNKNMRGDERHEQITPIRSAAALKRFNRRIE